MRFTDIDPNQISVVILGQDPYPNLFKYKEETYRYACGYSFAVEKFVPVDLYPKSLKNIVNSIEKDFKRIQNIKKFDDLHDYMFLNDPDTTKYYVYLLKDHGIIDEQTSKNIL